MAELTHGQLVRVLKATQFEYTRDLYWRWYDNTGLLMMADCSDLFAWGSSDLEYIQTEEDVVLLEQCLVDLREATGEQFPEWLTELYAYRKRKTPPADFMFKGEYAMDPVYHPLFKE